MEKYKVLVEIPGWDYKKGDIIENPSRYYLQHVKDYKERGVEVLKVVKEQEEKREKKEKKMKKIFRRI